MKKNKKSLKKATIGASLLMSTVLLCGNTVKTHAQADLTPEESQKLADFLATQPTNGTRTSLGLTNNVNHSTYKFNRNNFTSVFESRSTKTKLDKDYDFVLDDGDHAGETVHVKNWQDLECFDLSTAENHPDPSMGKFYFAKEVTFVTNDGTEFTERNVALPVEADGIERYDITAYPNRYAFDYPIEEADSRFTSDIGPTSDMAISGTNGYWQLFATVNEEIPYDTIAEIDENLKQGEVVEITQGEIGNKIGTFNFTIADDLGSRYLDYDADVIYNDLKDLFSTSSIQKDAFFVRDYGLVTYVEGGSVDPKTRVLHVGIDYTQYVTEDGTELKTKEYGVHEKETFNGYEFVETRTAENGDTVHVYKKVTTPTPEPEQPVTPTNPTDETPTQPETPTNPVEDTPAVPNPTPEPNVPVEETPSQPVHPTDETPVVPNNPTDNTVVPPTVEEKPVENTVSNKVEEDTAVNNPNSSTTSIKKDDRVIETGVRTNLFTNLAMTVVSGIGLLGLAFKKKESK
jgi:surface repeat SSSPR-51 protein